MKSLLIFLFSCYQVVSIVEHDFSNAQIQEHLQLAFENVPVVKVENSPPDEPTRKRSKKRKPAKKAEPVRLDSWTLRR